jgi:hypothetical protein
MGIESRPTANEAPTMARKLHIAVSVFFGLVTVAVCVLWVRSYDSGSFLYWHFGKYRAVLVGTTNGRAIVHTDTFRIGQKRLKFISRGDACHIFRSQPLPTFAHRIENGFQLVIPGWWVAFTTTLAAAAPWVQFRFSLRTLLIATTLVAVLLGFAVWAFHGDEPTRNTTSDCSPVVTSTPYSNYFRPSPIRAGLTLIT